MGSRTERTRGGAAVYQPRRQGLDHRHLGGRIPILASDKTSAALLDMKPAEFRSLVAAGALPRGREIAPGVVRWDTDQLRALVCGDAMDGDYEW